MKRFVFAIAMCVAFVGCKSHEIHNKANEEFCKIVEESLHFDISDNKVVAHFNYGEPNRDYAFAFLFNDDREDIVEIWNRYTRSFSYCRGEVVGWIINLIGDENTLAYPVKAPRYGVIEKEGYSLADRDYGCVTPCILLGADILFAMECDSVAICKRYMADRKLRLEEFEKERSYKRRLVKRNKMVRKNSDW